MNVRGSINIPEVAIPVPPSSLSPPLATNISSSSIPEELPPEPFSPTSSVDSGRWTGTALWPSSKYFVYGGPGFSIGIFDSTTGELNQLGVPVPTPNLLEAADANNFSVSEVTCLALAGECQVWAGSEMGSLHVFNLESGPHLSDHGYSKLPDTILCLRIGPLTPVTPSSRREGHRSLGREKRSPVLRGEVLVGSRNNTLTIISGEVDERGSLRNVAKCSRKVIQLGGKFLETEEEDSNGVHCVSLVPAQGEGLAEESYWCGCGPSIVVLKRSNWKLHRRLGEQDGLGVGPQYVTALEVAEHGVWCSMRRSPAMLLWDATDFTLKMKISCL